MEQQTDYLIQIIISMVKSTPNDADLGKKVRSAISPLIYAQEGTQPQDKQILKG